MRRENLPTINARYWVAITIASMCGTNTGDFASHDLHLGHSRGLLPLALIFAAILWCERRSRRPTEIFYWLGILAVRTVATNLADLVTHDLKLGYVAVQVCLAALMIVILVMVPGAQTSPAPRQNEPGGKLPDADPVYWLVMLIAGTLGTAMGDYVAGVVGLGVGLGSAVLLVVLAAVLLAATQYGRMTKPWYWLSVVAVRAAGTTMGDFAAGHGGLGLGLPVSMVGTAVFLTGLLVLWRGARLRVAEA